VARVMVEKIRHAVKMENLIPKVRVVIIVR
jgi:hypothetical protein